MHLGNELDFQGTVVYELKKGEGPYQTTISKEPDQAFHLESTPHSRSQQFPTVVLEVAYSESTSKLERDLALWLEGTNGDVKMAIGASVNPRSKTITIEGWELKPRPTMANLRPRMEPTPTQKMQIIRPRGEGE